MKITLESTHAFHIFSRTVLKAMEIANTYGSSTLTLTFTSNRSGTAFDISSEITEPEIKAEEPDLTLVVFPKEENTLRSKEKCVLEYIDKFDKIPVESLKLSNRVNTCVCRWLYRYLGRYTDCVISDLKPLIEEQSWKSVWTFGIKAYEELIDALYLKVVNSGAWILE